MKGASWARATTSVAALMPRRCARAAGEKARGATLYVTLEPCSHYGRTPPCADLIIQRGVRRVVAAMEDPNPLVAGRGFARLRDAGVDVSVGLLQDAAAELNEAFITYITKRRPFIHLKTAMSLDGKIACHTGASQWITGPLARQEVHRLRSVHDGIMVGIGTVLADDPRSRCASIRKPAGRTVHSPPSHPHRRRLQGPAPLSAGTGRCGRTDRGHRGHDPAARLLRTGTRAGA